jgi:Thrombospondin type 3 repeat/Bacterial TSP3 repeat
MKRMFILVVLAVALMSGCGGSGGGDELLVSANYPDKLAAYSEQLSANAMITGTDGQILSTPSDGVRGDGIWAFDIEALGNVSQGALLVIEYRLIGDGGVTNSTSPTGLLLSVYTQNIDGLSSVDPDIENFDFSADDDGDGMFNIDELIAGVDPSIADTDGDGVTDGLDMFPSIAHEWADTDGDGIGDNVDDDIDGDGLSNDTERAFGTNPEKFDTDDDGSGDGDDNCPLNANGEQADSDGDGVGDICEDDTDGDGLSDIDEARYGSNANIFDTDGDGLGDGADVAAGGNPLKSDTDDDGVGDFGDNCVSAANSDQNDIDSDGFGDVCDDDIDGDAIPNVNDNCTHIGNPYQENVDSDGYGDACDDDADNDGVGNITDNCPLVENAAQNSVDLDGDGVPSDCDMDDGDAAVLRERDGVFVDIIHGSDASRGTRHEPLSSISAAADVAARDGKIVYVSAGTYDVSDLLLPSGVSLFGGFANDDIEAARFATRDVRSLSSTYKTLLVRQDIPTTLVIANDGGVIDGFHIENGATEFDPITPAATLIISSGSVTIDRCTIEGNASARQASGVRVSDGVASITRSKIVGGGYDGLGSSSLALIVDGGELLATSNILVAGRGRFATGVSFDGGDVLFVNNTVDGRSGSAVTGVSEGITVSAGNPEIINNVILTGLAPDQYPLVCRGASPTSDMRISHNLLANFSGNSSPPIVVGCDGLMHADASFTFGESSIDSNLRFGGANRSNLINSSYALVGASGVDDGMDASASEDGGVDEDYDGRLRPMAGAYDIGAVEGN